MRRIRASITLARSRAPASDRESTACRTTSRDVQPGRLRSPQRPPQPGRLVRGQPVAPRTARAAPPATIRRYRSACSAGGLALPHRVQDGQVVGVGQRPALGLQRRRLARRRGPGCPPPPRWRRAAPGRRPRGRAGRRPEARRARARSAHDGPARARAWCRLPASATRAERVNTIIVFASAPRVIATYSHCRSSVPVTTGMPTCTERPWAE